MTRIEQHLGLLPLPDIPATNQSSDMLIDTPAISDSTDVLMSSRSIASPVQAPLNLLSPDFTPARPLGAPLSAPIDLSNISSPLLPLKRFLPPPKPAMKFKPLMQSIRLSKTSWTCSLTLLGVLSDPSLLLLLPQIQLVQLVLIDSLSSYTFPRLILS
ncbi:hypothetical protein RclHR1_11900004 [Rhizophagus clarus]|uniref:Uncharacterized protein n=1 Tax=Rhizophagus clarus TaxID=94130 RepID=A0A2Z6QKQ8_9GLOM|nr:hypothetical protein RclHR1_11900004 [Rhizophagus clarus]GES88631.1 hypothetical protein RCL_e22727_RclHR1_11900004 [Rhizophagus clarus]